MTKRTIIITLIGVLIGAILGYLYYRYVGCITGTCAITSNPLSSTLYGGLIGGLTFNFFGKKDKK